MRCIAGGFFRKNTLCHFGLCTIVVQQFLVLGSFLKPFSPTVLPGNSDQVKVTPGSGENAGTAVNFDGVMTAEGKRKCATNTPILLKVISRLVVHGSTATCVVIGVESTLNALGKIVNQVSLQIIERAYSNVFPWNGLLLSVKTNTPAESRRSRVPTPWKCQSRA